MVRVVPIGSGSSGNATLLTFGERRLLIDAGLSREIWPPGSRVWGCRRPV
jgi:hypothetical protein